MIALLFLLWPVSANTFDFDSYCVGYCQIKYQDGIFRQGKCFCGDYYSINLSQRFALPTKRKPAATPTPTGTPRWNGDY